jgi:hypothetical protein
MMLTSQKFCFCNWQSFTIRFFLTIHGLLIAQHALAQLSDTFSDGEFANAPAWSGNQTSFVVENQELRLKTEAVAGNAFLSVSSNAIQNASWECVVRMEFNPSGTNRAQIYIVSDSENLLASLNGYFVMIGDTPDEISLYRQSGLTKTKIIDGMNGRVNLSIVNTRIKVTRDDQGNWELFSDVGLTGTYLSEGTFADNTFTQSSWLGVLCTYTATRSDDFYFDDFVVTGSTETDITPPQVEGLNVTSSQSIELIFSEPLDRSTAELESNYVVLSGSMHPDEAILDAEEKKVSLSFVQNFANAKDVKLSISKVKDRSGNEMVAVEKTFFYFQPVEATSKDIIITEIFADPEPSQGLPAAEFIEILNRSEKVFDLSGWSIGDQSAKAILSSTYLFPGEYLVITTTGSVALFHESVKIVGVTSFPSLNNSGDVILFKEASGKLIDAVGYSETWYHDSNKQTGGWSLELIDPQNTCSESDNWTASEDERGGTPGEQNSVMANKPDIAGPRIVSILPVSSRELLVRFNEKLENLSLSTQQFGIVPAIPIAEASFADSMLTSVTVSLDQSLDSTTTYALTVHDLRDCAGNLIQEQFSSIKFGVPQTATQNDIIINEILFNPKPTGVDFVELYNSSSKFINLKSVTIISGNEDVISLSGDDRLLPPYHYVVVTPDPDVIIGHYPSSLESAFCELANMPSMNDDEGNIKLVSGEIVIDSFSYSKSMHSLFLKDDEGVSLERISFSEETNDPANWKSAASVAGFATPGFTNSNSRAEVTTDGEVTVEPEAFSPLESPHDFVLIHYKFDTGGYVANVDVVDAYGHMIYNLANNELLGTSGFFRWDGNHVDGRKARVGYYMVRFEVFDATGVVRLFRKRLAIASRF